MSGWCIALARPKSITFGTGWPSIQADQNVRRLQIAVDDPLLMRVLHGVADLDEQLEPLLHREIGLVAIFGDRHPLEPAPSQSRAAPTR